METAQKRRKHDAVYTDFVANKVITCLNKSSLSFRILRRHLFQSTGFAGPRNWNPNVNPNVRNLTTAKQSSSYKSEFETLRLSLAIVMTLFTDNRFLISCLLKCFHELENLYSIQFLTSIYKPSFILVKLWHLFCEYALIYHTCKDIKTKLTLSSMKNLGLSLNFEANQGLVTGQKSSRYLFNWFQFQSHCDLIGPVELKSLG